MDFKLIGCILLIVGTSIGAGMLALPIATAQLGFVGSLVLLFGSWFVMTMGALLILEVNLWLPQNSNLISMAKATIGPIGQIVAWVVFILLLYSLLCAYIAGGSDLFHNLLLAAGVNIPAWMSAIIFVCLFGGVVVLGIRAVDYVNRALMFVKMGAYVLLVALLMPFISVEKLAEGNFGLITSATAITVTIASFGFATIVPSLRIYFAGDVRKLRLAIVIGSLIPLLCYVLWDAAIMGIIPLQGTESLTTVMQSNNSPSVFVNTLNAIVARDSIIFFVKLFTSICVVTSFLGVALCLVDFLADGLQVEKTGGSGAFVYLLTFVPPFVIALFFPSVFINALAYAGIYSVVLLILLPAWMAWCGRYRRHLAKGYTVFGGKPLLAGLITFSLIMAVYGLFG